MAAFNPDGEVDYELEDMATYSPTLVSTPRLDRFLHYNRQEDERDNLEKLCRTFTERATTLLSRLTYPSMRREWYSAMKQRLYFEGDSEILSNHELQLPDYHQLLPYRYADFFHQILAGKVSLEDVGTRICEAISHSDGIVDEKVYSGFLCVRTNYSEGQELTVFKRFPMNEFRCNISQPADIRFIEYFSNTLHFEHQVGDASLDIHLDLFEILMRFREGYLPGADEQAPFVIDLAQFKSRLLRRETQEIILLESGRKLHRVTQEDGVIRRLPLEEVRT